MFDGVLQGEALGLSIAALPRGGGLELNREGKSRRLSPGI